MEKQIDALDWSLLRAFLAVADTGSLSGAARRLGASQPTLGRHIQTIEDQLGVALFQRHAKGLRLTATGAKLLPYAQSMQEAAHGLALTASGHQAELNGTVRLTASVFVAHHILPPILAQLRQREPGILIELVASDDSDNLLFREADIALRMYRPTQLDVTAQRLGALEVGAYAAPSYLERRGVPQTPEDLPRHDLVGFDQNDVIVRHMQEHGLNVTAQSFAMRTDHPTVYWQLVCAGCGIGFSQVGVARNDPKVRRVLPDLPLPALPVWLAAPTRTRNTPRIAFVWDHLRTSLRSYLEHSGRTEAP